MSPFLQPRAAVPPELANLAATSTPPCPGHRDVAGMRNEAAPTGSTPSTIARSPTILPHLELVAPVAVVARSYLGRPLEDPAPYALPHRASHRRGRQERRSRACVGSYVVRAEPLARGTAAGLEHPYLERHSCMVGGRDIIGASAGGVDPKLLLPRNKAAEPNLLNQATKFEIFC
ncbi:uncharacterized protein LOC125508421 [Triticum urartu]|uniref:uncharacterized protein LOC125508421 n=1 Tax=Triticum urartu TaxID=4572 RepID=UPI002042C172|nr:uncharacterized protein LOC125508421 [Triticum urartu]